MVDAADLKSAVRKDVWVRIPPPAPLPWHERWLFGSVIVLAVSRCYDGLR